MKKILVFMLSLVTVLSNGLVMSATATKFQVPYDESLGSYRLDGYHMEWYPGVSGYHMGEDWNRIPVDNEDGSVDSGDRLNALADGKVIYVNKTGLSGKGKVIIVRYTLPNGNTVDGVYYHCKTIVVKDNDNVTRGQKIAELGTTGTAGAHLHWQMETDPDLSIYTNPYHGEQQSGGPARDPMTPANALRYTSPSLFVDDRSQVEQKSISGGQWTFFTVDDYAPSSTAFISMDGANESFSIQRAVDEGYIHADGVVWNDDGQWYCYCSNVMNVRFEPGVQYAIRLNDGDATFNLMPPGHNYQNDRARLDMIRVASQDSRFDRADTKYFNYHGEGSTWRYTRMAFWSGDDGWYFYHATNKANPLIRFVYKYNIDTDELEWFEMDRNVLYNSE